MGRNLIRFAGALSVWVIAHAALAEDGVSSKSLTFGQVAALQGPAQDLGQGMRQGTRGGLQRGK